MYWLNFESWSNHLSKRFAFTRYWKDGYKWTPFVKVVRRKRRK